MSRKRDRIDVQRIRAEVHEYAHAQRVRKRMACGHEDHVPVTTDETTEVCWVCRMGRARSTGSEEIESG